MSKRMLADVLWEAANLYLAADALAHEPPYEFSCPAVTCALNRGEPVWQSMASASTTVNAFLSGLGCQTNSWCCFSDASEGKERQGVRYMWLLLAACVAEDEGITV